MFLLLPFLFVLHADGKLVHPQHANVFEDGDTYTIPSFAHFLTVCSPPLTRPAKLKPSPLPLLRRFVR